MVDNPNLSNLNGIVSTEVLAAMRAASDMLTKAKVRHALVGGLAVGAYGYPRASKDVDFLVGDEAFVHHGGGIITIAPGVPIQVGDIPIDQISICQNEKYLEEAVDAPKTSDSIPIAPIEALIYLKLKSPRRKDSADIIELISAGAVDNDFMTGYLEENAPDLTKKYKELLDEADVEE